MGIFHPNPESGMIPMIAAVAVCGVSLVLGYSGIEQVNKKIQATDINLTKSFHTARHVDVFKMTTALFNSGTPTQPAPIGPEVYIPASLDCESARSINSQTSALWSSQGLDISVKTEQKNLNNGEVFSRIQSTGTGSLGINSNPHMQSANNLRVEGFKCSDEPNQPFLITAVYLRSTAARAASGLSGQGGDTDTLLAEVPVSNPPRSECRIFVHSPRTNRIHPASGNGAGQRITVISDTLALNVTCNYVVTALTVFNNGAAIGGSSSVPTAANSLSAAYSSMITPITLTPNTHNISVAAQQPDGSTQSFTMGIVQNPQIDPAVCSYRCVDMPGGVTAAVRNYQHNHCYRANNTCGWGWSPEAEVAWMCYHPHLLGGSFYAFYPDNNCQPVLTGVRGIDFGGCFAGHTLITMGDGSLKRADAIRSGDTVYSPTVGEAVKVRDVVSGPELAELLEIAVGDRRVEVSQMHPFISKFGPVAAKNLKPGDMILDFDNTYRAVSSIRKLAHEKPAVVWNFILDGGGEQHKHLLLGNGIVSGDLLLQGQTIQPNVMEFAFGADF